MSEVEKLIAKYKKQWDKYGMGSVISYSQVVSDLIKIREIEIENQKCAEQWSQKCAEQWRLAEKLENEIDNL